MRYLVDTDMLTAVSRGGDSAPASATRALGAWFSAASDRLFLSVVTITDIETRITRMRTQGDVEQAGRMADWLSLVGHLYAGRILPMDFAIARLAGRMIDRANGSIAPADFGSAAIAATGSRHGLTILSRDHARYRSLDVAALNPLDRLPEL